AGRAHPAGLSLTALRRTTSRSRRPTLAPLDPDTPWPPAPRSASLSDEPARNDHRSGSSTDTGPSTMMRSTTMSDGTENGTTLVRGEELQRFTAQALAAVGMREDDAREMASQIVGSELAGHESHGLRRLPEYIGRARSGETDPAARPEVDIDRGALSRIDGRRGFGHLVVRQAT